MGPDSASMVTRWLQTVATPDNHGVGFAPVIAEDGSLYFGANQFLCKADRLTGMLTLSANLTTIVQQSSPALGANGGLFVGTMKGGSQADPARFFSMRRSDFVSNWFFDAGAVKQNDLSGASPVIGPDGRIVFASTNGNVYCIEPDTGTNSWTASSLGSAFRTPAFGRDDDRVFVSNGNTITALDYNGGGTLWSRNLGSLAGAPGVAPDGRVIVGNQAGRVWALEPGNGDVAWTRDTLGSVFGAPAFDEAGRVFVCSYDLRLYALDLATGSVAWSYLAPNLTPNAPVVGHDGRVYFSNDLGVVYALNPNGGLLWSLQIPGDSRGPMSIGPDGEIFAGFVGFPLRGLAIIRQRYTIGGTIQFQDRSGQRPTQVTLNLFEPGSGTPFDTRVVDLDSNGRFDAFQGMREEVDVSVKTGTWLRKVIRSNGRTGNNDLTFALVNGDVNGDNTINLTDFLVLRAAFGSSKGSGTWNADADLNGDGSVGVADFLILRKNFGASGA